MSNKKYILINRIICARMLTALVSSMVAALFTLVVLALLACPASWTPSPTSDCECRTAHESRTPSFGSVHPAAPHWIVLGHVGVSDHPALRCGLSWALWSGWILSIGPDLPIQANSSGWNLSFSAYAQLSSAKASWPRLLTISCSILTWAPDVGVA